MGNGGRSWTGAAIMVIAATMAGGCGGSDEPAPASTTAGAAPATTTANASPAPAAALKRYEVLGISALLPGDWKGDTDDTSVIVGPDDDKGAAALIVYEDSRTADEWIDKIVMSGYPKTTKVLVRKHVRIPTLGKGVRMVLRRPKSPPDYFLYVSTIDGLIVEVTVSPGEHLDMAQVNRILASPRRAG